MPVIDNSEVVQHRGGTSYVGKDGVNLFRAITLKASLSLFAKTGIRPTRHVTPTMMLTLATEYTGKAYKRGQYAQAAEDVRVWIETMKAAIPITDERA